MGKGRRDKAVVSGPWLEAKKRSTRPSYEKTLSRSAAPFPFTGIPVIGSTLKLRRDKGNRRGGEMTEEEKLTRWWHGASDIIFLIKIKKELEEEMPFFQELLQQKDKDKPICLLEKINETINALNVDIIEMKKLELQKCNVELIKKVTRELAALPIITEVGKKIGEKLLNRNK